MISFEQIKTTDSSLGGKALGLALLSQKGFPVPAGVVLESEPTESDWPEILQWWKEHDLTPLAVRSSAGSEDSQDASFAGQNRTFLNVSSPEALKKSVTGCFASIHRENSKAYRRYFHQNENGKMNVVLQAMVAPRFSGVFFSSDPLSTEAGWLLEVVPGLGESLVSGKVTPGRVREGGERTQLPEGFTAEQAQEVARVGVAVSRALGFPLDMEWCYDQKGRLQVLQARPITATSGKREQQISSSELKRIKEKFSAKTVWDGKTFSEWSGLPSPFTYSLWQLAFSPQHAFGTALSELGYRSFQESEWKPGESLLNRIFGRAYVNLERLNHLYFGHIPYSIKVEPRPHIKFDISKVGIRCLLSFPSAVSTMLRVGWNLATRRNFFYQRCLSQLSLFKHIFERPREASSLRALSPEELCRELQKEAEHFASEALHYPLTLVVLSETTHQSLLHQLSSALGEKEAAAKFYSWLGKGLHTVTFEMQNELALAGSDPRRRPEFLAKFGHRGPGEMDLKNPRWRELGESLFSSNAPARPASAEGVDAVEKEIAALPTFRRELIAEEWRWLKRILEAREAWKMELLKPYSWIREILSELGRKTGLGEGIHYLLLSEVLELGNRPLEEISSYRKRISQRQEEERVFRRFSLPDCLAMEDLGKLLEESPQGDCAQLDGTPLSGGVAFGEVRFVSDPAMVDLNEWPENVILVAESTDPGWTSLFARCKGIVVEHGGVLSHCAILAREMGVPSVGGVRNLAEKLKSGEKIWLDGNHGRITRASS